MSRNPVSSTSGDTRAEDKDDTDVQYQVGLIEQRVNDFRNNGDGHGRRPVHVFEIEDEDNDEIVQKVEQELESEIELIDLTEDLPTVPVAPGLKVFSRNKPLGGTLVSIPNYTNMYGLEIRVDTTYEFSLPLEDHPYSAQWIKIKTIFLNKATMKATLRGLAYTRTRNLRGMLPRKANEVCLILEIDDDDPRDVMEQALVEVDADAVFRARFIHVTNQLFPKVRFVEGFDDVATREEQGGLVCRWQFLIRYKNASMRRVIKGQEFCLLHIREEESHTIHAIKEADKLNGFRGAHIDLEDEGGDKDGDLPSYPYSAIDVFCGAGGASRGIERAGFDIQVAVDHWRHACSTYSANFQKTKLVQADIFDFINDKTVHDRPDVLHLSPPCQVWSPAHTVEGKNDGANEAVLFACMSIIGKLRPRIFTLEQTFGLLHQRFELYFNVLIQGFTCYGYSVRWRVMYFNAFGLPQPRKRLVVIGACPGQTLPPFPKPTHGPGAANSFVTVAQTLRKIRPGSGIKNHNPREMRAIDRTPWDSNRLLPRSITCSGGQNYHPSGRRDLTLREYASLQGFPTWHKFEGSCIKRQIGNAFPACVVRVLYNHIKEWLLREDYPRWVAAGRIPASLKGPSTARNDSMSHGVEIMDIDDNDADARGPSAARRGTIIPKDEDIIMLDVDDDLGVYKPITGTPEKEKEHEDDAMLTFSPSPPGTAVGDQSDLSDAHSDSSRTLVGDDEVATPASSPGSACHGRNSQSPAKVTVLGRQLEVIDLTMDSDTN